MTAVQLFTNNAIALLAASIGPTDLTLTVQAGYGALYPQPVNPGDFFLVTLEPLNPPLSVREILYCTGRVGDVITIQTRGYEGTGVGDGQPGVGLAWPATTTIVDHRVTAGTMVQAMLQPVPPISGSGGIVYAPTTIDPTTTQGVVQKPYNNTTRLFKFWVQMYDPVLGNAQAFEVFIVVEGILDGSETYDYTINNQIGFPFDGQVVITLDTIGDQVTLAWQNNEPTTTVIVSVTSL